MQQEGVAVQDGEYSFQKLSCKKQAKLRLNCNKKSNRNSLTSPPTSPTSPTKQNFFSKTGDDFEPVKALKWKQFGDSKRNSLEQQQQQQQQKKSYTATFQYILNNMWKW
jgi:hypothetical protein